MAKHRWFRFHIDRWRSGTFGLPPNELAVYLDLICELYDRDGLVKLNRSIAARRVSMRPTSYDKAISALLERGKIRQHANGFVSIRSVEEEVEYREKKSARNRRDYQRRKGWDT